MAKVSINLHYPTLEAIDAAMELAQEQSERPYLGMSSIGHPCVRKPWLDFRFASPQIFKAATLRKFEDGHYCEDLQAKRLRMVQGVKVDCFNAKGEQHGFKDLGGHLRGHMDGAVYGILEAPKTWHVWEHKATDDKKKNALEKLISEDEKSAFEKWDHTYFVQAQMYMHYSGMTRHYLTVSSAGGRTAISCRTNYQPEVAEKYIALATSIIATDGDMPAKVSESADYFVCKYMCNHSDICHENNVANISCRTCAHSETSTEGDALWLCRYHNTGLSIGKQKLGCPDHIYNPVFLKGFTDAVDADENLNAVKYQNHLNGQQFWNGNIKDYYRSTEIKAACDKAILGDTAFDKLRLDFDGRIDG